MPTALPPKKPHGVRARAARADRWRRMPEVVHNAMATRNVNDLETIRSIRILNANRIYLDLDVVKHAAFRGIDRVANKIKQTCLMSKIKVPYLNIPHGVHKNMFNRVRARFNKTINSLKIQMMQMATFIRCRFGQWLGSMEYDQPHTYDSKMSMVEYYRTMTMTEIQRIIQLIWGWFNLYLSAIQLSLKNFCWKSKSATQFLERYRGWHKQARKLCTYVMNLVDCIMTASYGQIGSFSL